MNTRNFIITNNILWKVISVVERKYQRCKRSVIEMHLKGDRGNWLIDYTDYHVTVRGNNEDFDRIFVFIESEAKEILFYE